VRIDRRDTRCTVVNVNPGTGQPDAPMLTVIGRSRQVSRGLTAALGQGQPDAGHPLGCKRCLGHPAAVAARG
jgi:hypothetical protein